MINFSSKFNLKPPVHWRSSACARMAPRRAYCTGLPGGVPLQLAIASALFLPPFTVALGDEGDGTLQAQQLVRAAGVSDPHVLQRIKDEEIDVQALQLMSQEVLKSCACPGSILVQNCVNMCTTKNKHAVWIVREPSDAFSVAIIRI